MNARLAPIATLFAAGLVAAGTATAGPRGGDAYTTQARVISSTPIYETINEPRRECWTETVGYERVTVREGNNTGGAIIGAIAGGLIGSTVGKGNGRVAAAAVGAATGAVVGDRWNDGDRYYESRPRQVERCTVRDNFRQVITGYDVRYRFDGREYTTRLPYDPGRTLTLSVNHVIVDSPNTHTSWNNGHHGW